MTATQRQPKNDAFHILFHVRGTTYHIVPLTPAAEVARKAYRFEKLDPEGNVAATYDVALMDHGPSCECMGFLRWGHCKHCDTLRRAGMFG
jgi:hypothetical protein